MTTLVLASSRAASVHQALAEAGIRAPSITGPMRGPLTLAWEPDLTTEEQAAVDAVVRLSVGSVLITAAEYETIRPHITTIRDLRQMGRNAFMALTAAERDRLMYDAQAATTTILLALLRDP
jgi:hypothetical protein